MWEVSLERGEREDPGVFEKGEMKDGSEVTDRHGEIRLIYVRSSVAVCGPRRTAGRKETRGTRTVKTRWISRWGRG